jgi:uncharacterized protein
VIRQPICPICSKVISREPIAKTAVFPFCSERCRQVDLLRWSRGEYVIVEPLDTEQLDREAHEPEE